MLPVGEVLRSELRVSELDGEKAELDSPGLRFVGKPEPESSDLGGFIYFGQAAYRVTLPGTEGGGWATSWGPLSVPDEFVPLDLYFDDDGSGGTGGYLFFRDQRLPGLYGLGAHCEGQSVTFREMNLGLEFTGEFDDDVTTLSSRATGFGGTAAVTWQRMSEARAAIPAGTPSLPPRDPAEAAFVDRAPPLTDDGWPTAKASDAGIAIEPLRNLVASVAEGNLPLAHSVLVARSGKLVVEEYFYGFDRDVIHDMRSASKSIASTLIGLAVSEGLLEDADVRVLDLLDYESYDNPDERKSRISVRHLMTMSSGLDANDSDRNSAANENTYQSQTEQPDWIKLALDVPMIAEPGQRVIYGSANPMILAAVLESVLDSGVEWFADEALFAPLGIDDYRIFMRPDDAGVYLGGGMYLTPRDMLKIGQLYLDDGEWQGEQLLPKAWVEESFGRYGRLEPVDRNGNQYGYLWWHESYSAGDRTVDSVEARGNGGQYIFVVPELDAVVVITAGNFRGGLEMTRQSQRMFETYVLPALLGE